MQRLHEMTEGDTDELARNLSQIMHAADAMAAAAGRGSFQVDGKMIDIPVIERARKLLARHEAIERRMKR